MYETPAPAKSVLSGTPACVSRFPLEDQQQVALQIIASLNSFADVFPLPVRENLGFCERRFGGLKAEFLVNSVVQGRKLKLPNEVDRVEGVEFQGCAAASIRAFKHGALGNHNHHFGELDAILYKSLNHLQRALVDTEIMSKRRSLRQVIKKYLGPNMMSLVGDWTIVAGFLVEILHRDGQIIVTNLFAFPRRDTIGAQVIRT